MLKDLVERKGKGDGHCFAGQCKYQRDVELERVKNLDEEDSSVEARKSMMHMKSEHNACAKIEAEEIKAGYERAAVSRELVKQLDERVCVDTVSSSSSPRPNPVEGHFANTTTALRLRHPLGISESPLTVKKDPSMLVDTCHGRQR